MLTGKNVSFMAGKVEEFSYFFLKFSCINADRKIEVKLW